MGELPSLRSKRLLGALLKSGFVVARSRGSHRFLKRTDGRAMVYAFHDGETIGPRMLARVLKDAGLTLDQIRSLL